MKRISKFIRIVKRIIATTMIATLVCMNVTSCGKKSIKNDKLTIVTTIFPEYDWVMNILGDKAKDADVTLLLDDGVDLHSYNPSAEDILKIKSADVFIYVGGESDAWVDDVLKDKLNKDMKVVNLLDELGDSVKEEEVVEGMQDEEHDHEDGEDVDHEDEHDHEDGGVENDEHVWLSLNNAKVLCEKIEEAISSVDKKNKETYERNTKAYTTSFGILNVAYENVKKGGDVDTIVVADRFPFRYLVDDCGLNYYAAFAGCSAESEASFETIDFLSKKIDELSLKYIFVIDNSDEKIAKTVIENTKNKDVKILRLDSMQSVTKKDIENGASYLKTMEENFGELSKALLNE